MFKKLILIVVVVVFVVVGCASSAKKYVEIDGLNDSNSATIVMYRTNTSFHALNPEKPYFYVDKMYVANLGTGASRSIRVSAGEHSVSSRESSFFMEGRESGNVKGDFKAGKTYYIRYSKELRDIVPTGTGFSMSGSTSLQPSNEEGFRERK